MAELAYLSLGSNVGDRSANLQIAIQRLREIEKVKTVSSVYETEPVEMLSQPWFLNCVVALESAHPPADLLKEVLAVEREMGRVRLKDKGPRVIDIDILLFGNQVIDEPGLKIPHPAMHYRRFVLEPLAEIAPEARHPELGKTAKDLFAALPPEQVVRRLPQTGAQIRER